MTMLTANLTDMSFADAGVIALLGYGVVFLGLILLMIVVIIIGKIFSAAEKKNSEPVVAETEPVQEISLPEAPGSAGSLKLHSVDPKTAAMLMAITADKMGKPINELRFISIKEVE